MSLETVKSVLAKGGQHLGDIVYWTLAEARINRSNLESVWSGAQLAAELLPEPPTAEKAIKLAARTAAFGQSDRLVRLGLEDEAQVVFTVVREQRHDDGSLTYTQEARVILDRQGERASTDTPGHDLAEGILARYAEAKDTHPSDDIRRAMLKVLDSCAAVTLRDRGGVYWVPSVYADTVRRLQGAIEKIGWMLPDLPAPRSRQRRREPNAWRRRQARHRG